MLDKLCNIHINMCIIVKNSVVPRLMSVFIDVYAITLWPFIFIRDEGDQRTVTHEMIHVKQQLELWIVGFYLVYLIDWIRGLRIYDDATAAYAFIRFEQEAYNNHDDPSYPDNRKKFAWKEYEI